MRRLLLTLAIVAAPGVALASASLVLTDGRVIAGTDVVRQGDAFVLTLVDGSTASFPVELVKEMRFEDGDSPKSPPIFDYGPPKTLAGPTKMPSQDQRDQLRNLGPSTRWSKDAVDTTWTPTHAFDPDVDVLGPSRSRWAQSVVDTTWVPKSVFDLSKDVLAPSRSTWVKDVLSTTWAPADSFGFKPLWAPAPPRSAVPPPVVPAYAPPAVPSIEPETTEITPWSCAETIMGGDGATPGSLEVHPLAGDTYAPLGVKLYEAIGGDHRAIFTLAGGTCRLVGGDSDAIRGLNLTTEHAIDQDVTALDAASGRSGPLPGANRVDYAMSLVTLTDPQVSGARAAMLKLLRKPEELRVIAAKAPISCSATRSQRRKEERAATAAFYPPKTTKEPEGETVTFLTWSSARGVVYRNTVVYGRSGGTSTKRQAVASHIGEHKD